MKRRETVAKIELTHHNLSGTERLEKLAEDETCERCKYLKKFYPGLKAKVIHQSECLRNYNPKVAEKKKEFVESHLRAPDRSVNGQVIFAISDKCPFPIPSVINHSTILAWAESCRDIYESKNKFITVSGLCCFARDYKTSKILRELYQDERSWFPLKLSPEEIKTSAPAQTTTAGVVVTSKGKRFLIWTYTVTELIRWLGADGWTLEEAIRLFKLLKLEAKENTLKTGLSSGKSGKDVPSLSESEAEALRIIVKEKSNGESSPETVEDRRKISGGSDRSDRKRDDGSKQFGKSGPRLRCRTKPGKSKNQTPIVSTKSGNKNKKSKLKDKKHKVKNRRTK